MKKVSIGTFLVMSAVSLVPAFSASAQIVIGGGGGGGTIEMKVGTEQEQPKKQVASPRDSVTAKIGEATVFISYGRPSKKDREIFGGLVPFDKVWRTGANEATSLRTDKEIEIGGKKIPAGSYTLYTVPGKTEWTLVVNKQTGQWGTVYDTKQDLVRIPMKVTALKDAVEKFEIKLGAGELSFAWDKTKASVVVK